MRVETITITPDFAKWVLAEKNPRNRNLRPAVTSAYARDMKAGLWANTGEPLKFGENGNLLDGQHRLAALIEAQVEIEFIVITGAMDQDQMDAGMKRTLSDIFKMRGEANYVVLATMIRSILRWNPESERFINQPPSRTEAFKMLEQYPWLREGASIVQKTKVRANLTTTVGSLAYFWFWQIHPNDTIEFFKRVRDGGGDTNEGTYKLHRWLEREENWKTTGEKATLAMVIKAWNAYRDGSPVGNLRFRAGGARPERMPTPR